MKKRIILLLSAVLIVLGILFGIQYMLSFHKISFVLDSSVSEISIFTSGNKQVGTLTADGHLELRGGEYVISPKGDHIATDKITFSVEEKDKTITVSPPLSEKYLEEILVKELPIIKKVIASTYPSIYPKYSLTTGVLYKKGEWFGGILAPKVADIRNQKDSYRIVLHKKNDTWEVIRRPEYILTASRYSEVPLDILREINLLSQ